MKTTSTSSATSKTSEKELYIGKPKPKIGKFCIRCGKDLTHSQRGLCITCYRKEYKLSLNKTKSDIKNEKNKNRNNTTKTN